MSAATPTRAANSAFRISKKTLELNQRLNHLHSSTASKALPSNVHSLSLRYKGLKGNATLGKWVKEELPALKWANPQLKIMIEDGPKTPGTEPENLRTPGITIRLTDSKDPIFYPFPSTIRSQNVTPEFFNALSKPEELEALRKKYHSELITEPAAKTESAVEETTA